MRLFPIGICFAIVLCSSSAGAEEYWCSHPAQSCVTCEASPRCYGSECPEIAPWCSYAAEKVCPTGAGPYPQTTEPVFCAGNPVYESCVFVSATVCDESASTWCCAVGEPLTSEWFCPGGSPSECPATNNPCHEPECWPLFGQPPGPNGEQMKCSYALLPNGAPCPWGACWNGVCQ